MAAYTTYCKTMNHTEYQKSLRTKSEAELRYIIKDAGEAARANPSNPNVGYYLDEVAYAGMEIKRREGGGRQEATEEEKQPIEAWGVKGLQSKPWRKTFKNLAAMEKWCEKNDAEIIATREPDGVAA